MIFCARIWWCFGDSFNKGAPSGCSLYEQLIVANQGDDLSLAVDCVLTKHLSERNRSSGAHLIANVFDEG